MKLIRLVSKKIILYYQLLLFKVNIPDIKKKPHIEIIKS